MTTTDTTDAPRVAPELLMESDAPLPAVVPPPQRPRPVPPQAMSSAAGQVRSAPIEHSDDIAEFAAALAAAQEKFDEVEKNQTAKVESRREGARSYTYAYADLAAVLAAVRPALAGAGIALMQFPGRVGTEVSVTTMLVHKSGQWFRNAIAMPSPADPQAIGSAISYLRRYALQALVGVAPSDGEDDDAGRTYDDNADQRTDVRQPPPRPAQRKSAPAAPPASVGTVTEVKEQDGGAFVRLSTGFFCSTRHADTITAVKRLRDAGTPVELVTRAPSDPQYAPVLTEILPQATSGA